MSDLSVDTPATRKRKLPFRTERPERLTIGGVEMVRNDVIAREQGGHERTINRLDRLGAPYIMIAGCKYRPIERYHAFLLEQIVVRNQQPPKRHASRKSR
jgi:hypothetical protein